MNALGWLNPGRWLLVLAAVAALVAGYYAWAGHIGDAREAKVRAELHGAAEAQTTRNRELQRTAELRYTVRAASRDRFFDQTAKEIHDASVPLAACPLPEPVRMRLNAAASCARGDSSAACEPGESVRQPGEMVEGTTAQELAEWVVGWVGAYGCERSKRDALVEAWPR